MRKLTLFFACIWLLACTAPPVAAQTVYVTKTGKKYHDAYCRYLSHSKIEIDLAKALELGYDACSVCNPPTEVEGVDADEATPAPEKPGDRTTPAPSAKPAHPKPDKKAATSSQCSALTKAGTRCKRAASTNGRCWQHQ
ncbi:DUF5763 domain-containing protein [Dawidia soli]|uniref:Uncharacterized protein n=1 Tax=Dawidia soli TaxID=2782352 RepID=A0AAP2GIG1_9BACT|nr:DUF5763 domain-containing protein [Dawidia soli]MBT1688266.1 hypothetical protein [Dawidia soli]